MLKFFVISSLFITNSLSKQCDPPDTNHDWTWSKPTKAWFLLSNQKSDIYDFNEYCKSLNSNMAKILTQDENDLIKNLLDGQHNAWLAGHYVKEANNTEDSENWYWWDNIYAEASYASNVEMPYTNWDIGQPKNPEKKSWVTINGNKNTDNTWGKWSTRDASNTNFFLCEYRCNEDYPDPSDDPYIFSWTSPNLVNGTQSCRGCDPIGTIAELPKYYNVTIDVSYPEGSGKHEGFMALQIGEYYNLQTTIQKPDAKMLPHITLAPGAFDITMKNYLVEGPILKTYLLYQTDQNNSPRANYTLTVTNYGVDLYRDFTYLGSADFKQSPDFNCDRGLCYTNDIKPYAPMVYYNQNVFVGDGYLDGQVYLRPGYVHGIWVQETDGSGKSIWHE